MQSRLLTLVGATVLLSTATGCPDSASGKAPGETAESAPEETDCTSEEEIPYDEVDQDCDGSDLSDVDGDGYAWVGVEGGSDCDDDDASVHPGAEEICNGIDDDCDGEVDPACLDCDGSVPGTHETIQAAIDNALTGDVVCVAAGTYEEILDFGGAEISLVGIAGAAATIVDASGRGPVVTFTSGEGPETLLQGFTLTGGEAEIGAGVLIVDASPTLVDLVVAENKGNDWEEDRGAGIYVEGGNPVILDVVIRENYALSGPSTDHHGLGGGIVLVASEAILENVIVYNNSAGSGGGLYLEGGSPTLVGVLVSYNTASGNGGGLYLMGSAPDLTNVVIVENDVGGYGSALGGGMALVASSPSLTNVVIADNFVLTEGGGLYLVDSSPRLDNVVIHGNVADYGGGGGIYVESGVPVVAYTDTWGNSPDDYDGMSDPTGTDGNVSVDPDLLDDTWHLAETSPLIDAGDPTILDPDGSPSDIGAFGGPSAASWDLDGDGYASWWLPGAYDAATSPDADCDDEDADVYPGNGC